MEWRGCALWRCLSRKRKAILHSEFEKADVEILFRHFTDAEEECARLVEADLPLAAYDQCIGASHLFNMLDARGVIGVTERAAYIARVRALAKSCCESWLAVGAPRG